MESRCIANAHRILLLAQNQRPVVAEDFGLTGDIREFDHSGDRFSNIIEYTVHVMVSHM